MQTAVTRPNTEAFSLDGQEFGNSELQWRIEQDSVSCFTDHFNSHMATLPSLLLPPTPRGKTPRVGLYSTAPPLIDIARHRGLLFSPNSLVGGVPSPFSFYLAQLSTLGVTMGFL
jgi:hypothetical protein